MILSRIKSNWLLIGSIALMVLLVLAAIQQYRWMNRVSEADRRQRREFIDTTLRGTSSDFRETILVLLPYFRPTPAIRPNTDIDTYVIELADRWRATSDRPRLLGAVSVGLKTSKGTSFERLQIGDSQLNEVEWPASLKIYQTILEARLRLPGGEPPLFPNGFGFEFLDGRPVVVFPFVTNAGPPPPPPGSQGRSASPAGSTTPGAQPPESRRGPPPDRPDVLRELRPAAPNGTRSPPELVGWCFLELDQDYVQYHLIPELVNRNFSREALHDYQVAVITGAPARILYQSDPTVTIQSFDYFDGASVIFDRHMQPGRPGPPPPPSGPLAPSGPGPPRPEPPPPMGPGDGEPLHRMGPPELRGPEPRDPDAWRLVLKNRAGSLETLVDRERQRNLALSFGVLLILAGGMLMLGLATRRARSLANQQMEFVAGVSHELRTPLSVIQSASYNLSKGTIEDRSRVQKYGDVIQGEARRLINQVEQMLSFAGIRSGRKIYDLRPTDLVEIADRALAEYVPAFEEAGWVVEKEFDQNLPPVMADAHALESAIKNLLENARKYGAEGKWLRITARLTTDGKKEEIQLSIADHGKGIASTDLPHIFEPFFRGRDVLGSSTAGAGLGLSLVRRHLQAHGGRVTVESSAEAGTTFTLHLPLIKRSDTANE